MLLISLTFMSSEVSAIVLSGLRDHHLLLVYLIIDQFLKFDQQIF